MPEYASINGWVEVKEGAKWRGVLCIGDLTNLEPLPFKENELNLKPIKANRGIPSDISEEADDSLNGKAEKTAWSGFRELKSVHKPAWAYYREIKKVNWLITQESSVINVYLIDSGKCYTSFPVPKDMHNLSESEKVRFRGLSDRDVAKLLRNKSLVHAPFIYKVERKTDYRTWILYEKSRGLFDCLEEWAKRCGEEKVRLVAWFSLYDYTQIKTA